VDAAVAVAAALVVSVVAVVAATLGIGAEHGQAPESDGEVLQQPAIISSDQGGSAACSLQPTASTAYSLNSQ
jgi:hypothetical protein